MQYFLCLMNRLTPAQRKKTKSYSIVDGTAYSVMAGFGEQYVSPYAIRLGASGSEVALLSSVPFFFGSLAQFLGAKLTDKFRNRKRIMTIAVLLQALSFLPLFIVPLITHSILILSVVFALYYAFGNIASPAWNSLMGEVVLEKERSRYFSMRNRFVVFGTMLSVVFAGIILNSLDAVNVWVGFGILFGIALFGRLISMVYLAKHVEPEYVPSTKKLSFLQFTKQIRKNNFGKFVVLRTLVSFAVMVASPLFAVYMLNDLGYSYIAYTAVVLMPMVMKVLTVRLWGKYADRFGNRNIMHVSLFLIALIPICWAIPAYFLEGNPILFYFILFAEGLSGFAWAGFELSTFNYMLETSPSGLRARMFAYFNMIWGASVFVGGFVGSLLLFLFPAHVFTIKAIVFVFVISSLLRFLVFLLYMPRIKEVRVQKKFDIGKLFFDITLHKPLGTALQVTENSMLRADKNMRNVHKSTKKVITIIKKPIVDFVEDTTRIAAGKKKNK